MSRFYVSKEKINTKKNEILIEGEEFHHAIDVMRLKDSDKVIIFDGTGNEYTGFINKIDPKSKKATVEVVKIETPSSGKTSEVVLAQAIPKKGKMDYIVEKATELGVKRIVPLVTGRTIVRPGEGGGEKKVSRWRKLAIESAKQSGRADIPAVSEVTPFKKAIEEIERYDLALFACLSGKTVSLKKAVGDFKSGKIIVFVGPEGDFTAEEISLASGKNCRQVSLGWRVLKSDTAGLFLISVLDYEFNI